MIGIYKRNTTQLHQNFNNIQSYKKEDDQIEELDR